MKVEAGKMGAAFISNDFTSFAKYTNPKILQLIGGRNKMIEMLTKTTKDMKAQAMSFNSITFDEPSKMIKRGNEIQCTIQQHTEIKLRQGRVVATSTLIAISLDNGINWTFIDTTNKKLDLLKQIFPSLSSEILIPCKK
jgi:hypothetical protein